MTLSEYFAQRRGAIADRLKASQTPKQGIDILRQEVTECAALEGECMRTLTSKQARLARTFLDSLDASLQMLAAAYPGTPLTGDAHLPRTRNEAVSGAVSGAVSIAVKTAVGKVAGGSPLGLAISLAAALAASAGGAVAVERVLANSSRIETQLTPSKVDYEFVLDAMEQTLRAIGDAIDENGEPVQEKIGLESFRDALEFFQSLLGEAHNERASLSPTMQKRIAEATKLLQRHGISVDFGALDANPPQVSADRFDTLPHPNGTESVVAYPAILLGKTVLLKGEILVGKAVE